MKFLFYLGTYFLLAAPILEAGYLCTADCQLVGRETVFIFPKEEVKWQKVRCEERNGTISLIHDQPPGWETHYRCMVPINDVAVLSSRELEIWVAHRDIIRSCKDFEYLGYTLPEASKYDKIVPVLGEITCEQSR